MVGGGGARVQTVQGRIQPGNFSHKNDRRGRGGLQNSFSRKLPENSPNSHMIEVIIENIENLQNRIDLKPVQEH